MGSESSPRSRRRMARRSCSKKSSTEARSRVWGPCSRARGSDPDVLKWGRNPQAGGRAVMDKGAGLPGWWRGTGAGELLRLAWPLVLSNGCWALQLALHRLLLSRAGGEEIGAITVGTTLYWTPICLLSNVAGYAGILVSQYVGAGQPERVG